MAYMPERPHERREFVHAPDPPFTTQTAKGGACREAVLSGIEVRRDGQKVPYAALHCSGTARSSGSASAASSWQNTPQQLCVNYLIGTQLNAGEGLVAAALAIAALWCVYAVPAYLDMTR